MTRTIRTARLDIGALLTTLGLTSLIGLTSGCSTPEAAAAPVNEAAPVRVDAIVAETQAVPRKLTLTGTLTANRQAEVAADGAGRILQTFVERGDTVDAGAPLARLDARAAALSQAEARASAAALLAESENAKLECQRAERLFAANAISRAEFDRSSTGCTTSTYSADAAKARAGLAQKALSDALVRAPFRGVVGERRVSAGDYVTPGRTLVTLVDSSTLRLEIAVPESAVGNVKEGRAVAFSVAAHPQRSFAGRIARLSPNLRPTTRDQIVEVAVDNADGALRPGMFATVRLAIAEERLPVIPATAVLGSAPSERVFVVTREFRAEERVITTGERMSAGVAIENGIAAGEAVVAVPPAGLRDGARVQ